MLYVFAQSELDGRIARRKSGSAKRNEKRKKLDANQAARLVRYAEAHARLSVDFKGKALSRELAKALPDLYAGRPGQFRADREAFESARVESQQIPRADEE